MFAAYTTLRPELEKQKDERLGQQIRDQHGNDKVVSKAIIDDMREAGHQVDTGGFAWGIREAIWGKPEKAQPARQTANRKGSESNVEKRKDE